MYISIQKMNYNKLLKTFEQFKKKLYRTLKVLKGSFDLKKFI